MSIETLERQYHILTCGREKFEVDVRYSNLKPVGDGAYGFVCSADDAVTGEQVAIKKVADVFSDLIDAKRILRELKLLRHLDGHENVVNIIDCMTIPANTHQFRDIYIVTRLFDSDMDRIITSGQDLTDQHFQYFLFQILRGLRYIHSANVLHRDMKPSNLLVNANCDLAVCDFGLARGFEGEKGDDMTEYVVTRWYRAPELLCEVQNYGKGVDIWSVGCIFAEMLCRRPIFQGRTPQDQLSVIIRKLGTIEASDLAFIENRIARQTIASAMAKPSTTTFPELFEPGTNPLAIDLAQKMLAFNPEKRISVEEALAHPYLRDLHEQMDEPTCGSLFDFLFEQDYEGGEIPLPDLQRLMYDEMLKCRARDEIQTEISSKLSEAKI